MDFSKSTMAIQTEGELKAGITANILGMIEGSDQKLKEEAVLVCGHLDHIGITEDRHVFNGANDNASGSTAVLEIGQAFAINPIKPRRTIIFAHWTGEEKGLLGSRFFTKFPTFPLKNIVACLNLDMIGREFSPESLEVWKRRFGTAEGLEAIKADDFKRLVILSVSYESPEIREIVRSTALTLDLVLATRTCTMDDGGDERNFYFHEIPSVLFSSAIPKEYHTPDDTIDKINGKTFEQITRLAYLVASEIANRDTRLFWEKKTDFSSSPARESRITEKRIRGLD
jgi:Zn-dependent M28 family amino/carboxypeptidase